MCLKLSVALEILYIRERVRLYLSRTGTQVSKMSLVVPRGILSKPSALEKTLASLRSPDTYHCI